MSIFKEAQLREASKALAVLERYLVVDAKKCTGCSSCMLACSMVHHGVTSLSLSRIQIINDAFGSFPTDIEIAMCRQCDHPECYFACPVQDSAFWIDERTGIKHIHQDQCIGCELCIGACPFTPSRVNFDRDKNIAFKCDLCSNTPYWDSRDGQACVEVCPVKAIRFSVVKPPGYDGYRGNLRGKGWAKLDLAVD
jgi:protein NrfC